MSEINRNEIENDVFCPLLNKTINTGYCWELCNIGTDEILMGDDKVPDWDKATEICRECGRYND